MGEEYICVQPEYVSRFICDGMVCNAKCCRREWRVQFDKAAYNRYLQLGAAKLRDIAHANIAWNDVTGAYEFVPVNGHCPFLRQDDLLCALQKELGAGALTDVCAEYPRKTHMFPGVLERALCLTCPLAVEMALSDRAPMRFERVMVTSGRKDYFLPADNVDFIKEICFFDLQFACIDMLQHRSLSLDQRLMGLGFMLEHADGLWQDGRGREIANMGALYNSAKFIESLPGFLSDIGFAIAEYKTYMSGLLDFLQAKADDDYPATAVYFDLARSLLADGPTLLQSWENFRQQVWPQYGYMLENYLVNEFFLESYPCMVAGSFWHNYRLFLLFYKLLELFLLALYANRGVLSGKDIFSLVEWVSIRTNHFVGYVDLVAEYMAAGPTEPARFMERLLDGRPVC